MSNEQEFPRDLMEVAVEMDRLMDLLDPDEFSHDLEFNEGKAWEKLARDWQVHRWRYLKTANFVPRDFDRLAEIGCNNGILAVVIAKLNPGSTVVAIDKFGPFARLALEFGQFAGATNLQVYNVHAGIMWPDCDYLTMCEVLEHIPEHESKMICRKLLSAVKPGGGALITVPNRDNIPSPGHLHEFDEKKLIDFVKPHVYRFVDLHQRHLAMLVRVIND